MFSWNDFNRLQSSLWFIARHFYTFPVCIMVAIRLERLLIFHTRYSPHLLRKNRLILRKYTIWSYELDNFMFCGFAAWCSYCELTGKGINFAIILHWNWERCGLSGRFGCIRKTWLDFGLADIISQTGANIHGMYAHTNVGIAECTLPCSELST